MPSPRVDHDTDVLIVGAGPAGTASAVALLRARPALRVVLLDRARFPRDKSCGDALGPGAVEVLHRLRLGSVLEGYPPNPAYEVHGPDGSTAAGAARAPDGSALQGHVIPRRVLDSRLADAARASGALLFESHTFRSMAREDGRWLVTASSGQGEAAWRTRLLIGADGAYSRVRMALGAGFQPRRAAAAALRAYVEVGGPAHLRPIAFEFGRDLLPAYAWLFPIRPGLANLGVGMGVPDLRRRGGGQFLRAALGGYHELLRSRGMSLSPPRDRLAHLLPLAGAMPPLAHPGALLLGDAGAMINPFSGEGIAYALHAAAMAAPVIATAIDDPPRLQEALATFERAFRRRFGAHYRSALAAQRLVRAPLLARGFIRAAAADQRFLEGVVALLFAEGRVDARLVGRGTLGLLRARP